MNKMIDTILY